MQNIHLSASNCCHGSTVYIRIITYYETLKFFAVVYTYICIGKTLPVVEH